ncbi:MerR family transcriptional regulator [Vagococcus bubulae]|uniref:MerR family transcriptional regulator n=1 Tax=Vagococcus bubulae TaxID=1977868 RepID=A0A429ZEP7_9ENTE|nr:MerR family transcriptional regulator [Vagococcus bubulae]RST92186.1 MerR family transcriptional regulator [Vagococcus bubulae]
MYRIKKVSELTHISISTLRYYEELNLLTPSRTNTNYREYSEKDIEWINFIKRIKATGMSLKDIQLYSELRNKGDETILERMDMLDKQKSLLKEQMKAIQNDISFIEEKEEIYQKMLER